jgi:hypothetical protein
MAAHAITVIMIIAIKMITIHGPITGTMIMTLTSATSAMTGMTGIFMNVQAAG